LATESSKVVGQDPPPGTIVPLQPVPMIMLTLEG
jgi:hypothetical protein